jgi:hypothetical protein
VTTDDERERASFARLFPGASVRRRLRPHRPEVGIVAARSWHVVSLAAVLAGAAVIVEILLLSGPPSIVGFGWELPLAAGIALVGGLLGFAWSAHQVRPRAAEQPTTWETWAEERGFEAIATRRVGSGDLRVAPSRSYTRFYEGTLGGGVRVVIGNAYLHGPWGSTRNRALGHVAALVTLPDPVGERFPGSTVDRFLRGTFLRGRRRDVRLRELRLESTDLDTACDVRVDPGTEDADWFRLFDPVMVDGLARDWPASWQQHRNVLVVYSPAPIGTLDAAQLDSVCAAVQAIRERFVAEAGRIASTPSPAEAAIRDERRRSHRARRALRRLGTTLAVLALLVAPIVTVVVLDEREDRRARERIERREQQFQREYAAARDAELATYALQQVAVQADVCHVTAQPGDDCSVLTDEQRAEVQRDAVLTDERVDAVEVAIDGDDIRAETRSEQGTTFVLEFEAARMNEGTRTCEPEGPQCEDGTWGSLDG